MGVREVIKDRRSVKVFDSSHVMPEDVEKELLSLALLSPTAFNIQHWRFVVVKDKQLLEQIKEVAWGQAQVTDGSLLVILCADLNAWKKDPSRYWANADEGVQNFMMSAIDGYYRDREQVQRDEVFKSCGIAAQTLMLAAKDMGYDSCPIGGFDFNKVAQLIQLPDDHVITMFVAIGKSVKDAWPRSGQLDMNEVVVLDRF